VAEAHRDIPSSSSASADSVSGSCATSVVCTSAEAIGGECASLGGQAVSLLGPLAESGAVPLSAPSRDAAERNIRSSVSTKGQFGKPRVKELLPGYRVALKDGCVGEVEFVASTGEALVSVDDGRPQQRPWFEETQREWAEGIWPQQVWVSPKQLHIQQQRHQLRERRDVADFRHALCCIRGRDEGRSSSDVAEEIGRPEEWVIQAWQKGPPAKPKHMEHWKADGFCEVRYLKHRYHKDGLYETIVQGVDWQQDKVWRVHKEVDGNWNLRTVKQCEQDGCGRSLQRVPDSSVKIGPGDAAVSKGTRPHSNWRCQKQLDGCVKCAFETPLGQHYYWWCPKHKWHVCQECQQNMPDKPTSKQIRGWFRGECPALDDLVMKVVDDFNLPDPQAPYGGTARYTIKMNWYPDGMAQVTDHRHDIWTILVSLGSPRVLNVDHARVLMDDGDVILFGTQKHGVPVAPPAQGGRLSLVFMFQPDVQIERAALHLAGRVVPGFKPRQASQKGLSDLAWAPQGQRGDEQWNEEQWNEEDISSLCALGFEDAEVQQALIACDGDVASAANLLFGV